MNAANVLTAAPAEAEQSLSFAALGDLLAPVLGEVEQILPRPQWRALAVALLMEEPGMRPPDERAVALASSPTLRVLAGSGPVVVAIDDLQWLDEPTANVVRFALRRVRDEPIGFLLACRNDHSVGAGGPGELAIGETILGPLSVGAVHRLLIDRIGLELSRPRLRRLHELAGGNPFYALSWAGPCSPGASGWSAASRCQERWRISSPPGSRRCPTGRGRPSGRVCTFRAEHPSRQPSHFRRRRGAAPACDRRRRRLAGRRPGPLHPPTAGVGRLRARERARAASAPPASRRGGSRPGGEGAPPRARRRRRGCGRRRRARSRRQACARAAHSRQPQSSQLRPGE